MIRFEQFLVVAALASACGGTEVSTIRRGGGGGETGGGQSGASHQSRDAGQTGDGGHPSDAGQSGTLGRSGAAGQPSDAGQSGAPSGDAASGGASSDSGVDGRPLTDAELTEVRRAACLGAFDLKYSPRCGGPVLLPDEIARRRALFEHDCMLQFDMPGNGVTPASLAACTAATRAASCERPEGPPLECDLRGTLPGGAPCFLGTQCQSGSCPNNDSLPALPLPFRCGTCTESFAAGMPCSGACPAGYLCRDTVWGGPNPTCRPIPIRGENDPCQEILEPCEQGLYCDRATHRCLPLGGANEPCGNQWGAGCKAPFLCNISGTCVELLGVGARCFENLQCFPGLACNLTTMTCQVIQWAEPGETCDEQTHSCRTGHCETRNSSFLCPFIVGAGEACDASHHCDEGSMCFEGKCVESHAVDCR